MKIFLRFGLTIKVLKFYLKAKLMIGLGLKILKIKIAFISILFYFILI